MKTALKSREVRKYFMNHPNAKPKHVASKFGVYLPDVYNYNQEVQRAKDGRSGIKVMPDGRIVRSRKINTEVKTEVQPTRILATQSVSKDILDKFVVKFSLDYKHAYALELLVKGDVNKAAQVLTD